MPATVIMTRNPQKIYITATNTNQTLDYSNMLGKDDFQGTILIDNISAPVRFNTEGAVDSDYSAVYTTTDKCVFDARRKGPEDTVLNYYGASGTSFQVTVIS